MYRVHLYGCIALGVLLSASIADAQQAENTAAACQDGYDNDSDRYTDCDDQDCGAFVFCARAAQPSFSRHWALGGAIVGISAAPVVAGLTVATELTNNNGTPVPDILGGVTFIVAASLIPVTAAGGISVRRASSVRGCLGCRIAGWIFYGLAMAEGLTLLILGIGPDIGPPPGVITSVGLEAILALSLFSADAMIGRRQARDPARQGTAHSRRLVIAPYASPLRGDEGLQGAVVGLSFANM